MGGLAQTFTPTISGSVYVFLSGVVHQGNTGVGTIIQGRWAQNATPPAVGAAVTGTAFGRAQRLFNDGNSGFLTFIAHAKISGLSIGNTHWFDVSVFCGATGAAQLQDVQFTILEGA
jgi:hypothetical protein